MYESFTVEALIKAMVPIKNVLDVAKMGNKSDLSLILEKHYRQQQFAVSKRYLTSLLREYVKSLEKAGSSFEDCDDLLMELIFQASQSKNDMIPDPNECCYQSFQVDVNKEELKIRVFPKHNDVSLKLWEAGACLAEYFILFPDCIKQKRVVEFGAGVGLTSLVATNYAARVHMTDYTALCLENMKHNININRDWCGCPISSGYLEWNGYSEMDSDGTEAEEPAESLAFLVDADVLIAADVVYDVAVVPDLAKCVQKFLSCREDRVAIFATTFRNKATFDLFHSGVEELGVVCKFESADKIAELPCIFPVYHVQPRDDIRICFIRARDRRVRTT